MYKWLTQACDNGTLLAMAIGLTIGSCLNDVRFERKLERRIQALEARP